MFSFKNSSQQNHVGDGIKNLVAFNLSSLDAGCKPVRLQVLNIDKTFSPDRVGPHEKKLSFFLLFSSTWSISGLNSMHKIYVKIFRKYWRLCFHLCELCF